MSNKNEDTTFRYKAFISYSHAADNKLAPALQAALHNFAKPFYQLRAIRVFRDASTLRLTDKLWPEIQKSLNESEFFILMASPDAARSEWVKKELDEWLRLQRGSTDKLLILLTDGEIKWGHSTGDFDWGRTTALPENLKGRFKEEPLYSSFTWAKESTDLSLRNPRFLEEVGRIAARLHNTSMDEMVGKDVLQHRLFKFIASAVTLALLCLAVTTSGAAVSAFRQQKAAEAAADRERQARLEAEQAAERERAAKNNEELERAKAEEAAGRAEKAAEQERAARENEEAARGRAEEATANERESRRQAEERRQEAERQRAVAEQRRGQAEHTAYAAEMNVVQDALAAGASAKALTILEAQPERLRDFEWGYLHAYPPKQLSTLEVYQGPTRSTNEAAESLR